MTQGQALPILGNEESATGVFCLRGQPGGADAEQDAPGYKLPPEQRAEGNDSFSSKNWDGGAGMRDASAGEGAEEASGSRKSEYCCHDQDFLTGAKANAERQRARWSVLIPTAKPQKKNQNSAYAAYVLEEKEHADGADDREMNVPVQKLPVMKEPCVGVGERVPCKMGSDAYEHGDHDEEEAAAEAKWLKVWSDSALQVFRQESGYGKPGEAMVDPEYGQAEWEAEAECARDGVPPTASRSQTKEILEVRSDGAHDQRRQDQPRAAQGHCRRDMREREGHKSIMAARRLRALVALKDRILDWTMEAILRPGEPYLEDWSPRGQTLNGE